MPPKLTRSCSNLTTGVIWGKPSSPLRNGYSTGSPTRRAKPSSSAGVEMLVAEEDHEMGEPRAADRGDL